MSSLVETILANLPVGLLVIQADGTIMDASSSTCDILGCPDEGLIGKKWGELFLTHEENDEFSGVVFDAIQKEVPTIKKLTPYRMPNGTKRYLSVISSALRQDRKISEIVVIIEDLTELNRMHRREKAILKQNHKLANMRAESLISFAQSVAHQIRNPIMAISGLARMVERKMDKGTLEPLEAIMDETRKLESMVKAVAEYSAIALDNIAPVNLWVLIEEARHLIENHPEIKEQKIQWQTDCSDMSIKADRPNMAMALSELLLNSAEFGGDNVTIFVCAREEYPHILITVTDTGPGFTSNALPKAFDPFFTTKTVGAGMGLTRAKRIINEHQGNLSIDNTADGGAQAVISLPVEPY